MEKTDEVQKALDVKLQALQEQVRFLKMALVIVLTIVMLLVLQNPIISVF